MHIYIHPMFEKKSIQESSATAIHVMHLQKKVKKLWKIIKLEKTNYELYCFNGNAIRSSLPAKKLNLEFKESTTNINKFLSFFFFFCKFDFQLKIEFFFLNIEEKNDEYWPGKIKEEIEWIGEWNDIGANWVNWIDTRNSEINEIHEKEMMMSMSCFVFCFSWKDFCLCFSQCLRFDLIFLFLTNCWKTP